MLESAAFSNEIIYLLVNLSGCGCTASLWLVVVISSAPVPVVAL